jgi:lipopolysaccharide/colanic/teichoic acid biosynthesis glycosyltransferase
MHVGNGLKSALLLNNSAKPSDKFHGRHEGQKFVADAMQFCLTALGLVVVAPLFIIIAILIKLTSRGPVFYRGLRVGRGRRVFRIYKFRTLQVGAEEKIGARLLNEQDSYYTRVGKFLKMTKLDELPQLINVLKGDMNLVGPRPIRPIFLENLSKKIPLYNLRFCVKPGMTGLAQIKGGYFTDPKDKLRYELVYIRNSSILLDLKLIFLTFLKLLNRWFTLGLLWFTLFIFISFIPETSIPSIDIHIFRLRLNVLHILIIFGGGWLLAKRIPKGRFYVFHTPINLPILLFFLFTTISSYFAFQPLSAFRGALYYVATGFMIVFLITNGEISPRFILNSTKIVALFSVFVAFAGLFELFLVYHLSIFSDGAYMQSTSSKFHRISSTLGNPVILSTYLVLGFPLLLCELAYAEKKPLRDFWLISTTIVFINIILTQTRIGLLSLAVTGSIFFYKNSKAKFITFLFGFILLFLLLIAVGGPRYSPHKVILECRQALITSSTFLSEMTLDRLIIGVGANNAKNYPIKELSLVKDPSGEKILPPSNMHLLLIIENGIIGWMIMMWIIFAALRKFYISYVRLRDLRFQMILWAIFASISGFIISMNNLETFSNMSLQVLFWGLLGVGTAITVRFSTTKPGFIKVWKFED